MKHFNKLSPAEAERLAILAEECGETIQIIGKILRHGYESYNPTYGEASPRNRALLEKETGDVLAAIEMLTKAKDIDAKELDGYRHRKLGLIRKYLHHQ